MSNIKYILGHFEDPDDLMHGIDKLQENSVSIYDVYTPMPIHGIEDKLGIKRSRLGKVAFCFGLTGTITAISMITYMLVIDWPMNIGGKPHFAFPDFIPIMFELTVLFSPNLFKNKHDIFTNMIRFGMNERKVSLVHKRYDLFELLLYNLKRQLHIFLFLKFNRTSAYNVLGVSMLS